MKIMWSMTSIRFKEKEWGMKKWNELSHNTLVVIASVKHFQLTSVIQILYLKIILFFTLGSVIVFNF